MKRKKAFSLFLCFIFLFLTMANTMQSVVAVGEDNLNMTVKYDGSQAFNSVYNASSTSVSGFSPDGQCYKFTYGMTSITDWGSLETPSSIDSITGVTGIVFWLKTDRVSISVPVTIRDRTVNTLEYFSYDETKPKYLISSNGYKEPSYGKMPGNFEGWVLIPLSSFKYDKFEWNATDNNQVINNIELFQFNLAATDVLSLYKHNIYLDDIGYYSDEYAFLGSHVTNFPHDNNNMNVNFDGTSSSGFATVNCSIQSKLGTSWDFKSFAVTFGTTNPTQWGLFQTAGIGETLTGKNGVAFWFKNLDFAVNVPVTLRDATANTLEYFTYNSSKERYLIDVKTGVSSSLTGSIPANFEGWVIIPFSSFQYGWYEWNATDNNMILDNLNLIQIGFSDSEVISANGRPFYFDDFGTYGDEYSFITSHIDNFTASSDNNDMTLNFDGTNTNYFAYNNSTVTRQLGYSNDFSCYKTTFGTTSPSQWGLFQTNTIGQSMSGQEGVVFWMKGLDYAINVPITLRDATANTLEYFTYDNTKERYLIDINTGLNASLTGSIPANFEGWVMVPFSSFQYGWYEWTDIDNNMTLDNVNLYQISLGDSEVIAANGRSYYFDDFGVYSDAYSFIKSHIKGFNDKSDNNFMSVLLDGTSSTHFTATSATVSSEVGYSSDYKTYKLTNFLTNASVESNALTVTFDSNKGIAFWVKNDASALTIPIALEDITVNTTEFYKYDSTKKRYLVDKNNTFIANENGDIPANFEGWVVIPYSSFVYEKYTGNTTDKNQVLDRVSKVELRLGTGRTVYLDDISTYSNCYELLSGKAFSGVWDSKKTEYGFGFYHLWPSSTGYTEAITSNYLNTIVIGGNESAQTIQNALVTAKANNAQVFVSPHNLWDPNGLLSNWQTIFNQINQTCIDSGAYDALAGWYLDEPFGGVITNQAYIDVTKYNHDNFGKRFFSVFHVSEFDKDTYDDGTNRQEITQANSQYLTDAGYDYYSDFYNDKTLYEHLNADFKTHLGANLSNIKIWYVPCTHIYSSDWTETKSIENFRGMYEFLKQEVNPGGIMNYTWGVAGDTVVGYGALQNSSNSPYWSTLKSEVQSMGRRIVGGEFKKYMTQFDHYVTGVSLDKLSISIGKQVTNQLIATITPANATNKNVSWSSSNTAVATVSSAGLVTGIGVGTANITATTVDGGFVAACAVTVKRYDPTRYYKITYDSNSALSMDATNTGLNGVVKNITYTGADSQRWQIIETTDASTFKIVNKATGYALKVNSTTNSTGKQIIQTTYTNENNMNFTILESTGYVQIRSKLGTSTNIKCTGSTGGTLVTAASATTTRWDITLLP